MATESFLFWFVSVFCGQNSVQHLWFGFWFPWLEESETTQNWEEIALGESQRVAHGWKQLRLHYPTNLFQNKAAPVPFCFKSSTWSRMTLPRKTWNSGLLGLKVDTLSRLHYARFLKFNKPVVSCFHQCLVSVACILKTAWRVSPEKGLLFRKLTTCFFPSEGSLRIEELSSRVDLPKASAQDGNMYASLNSVKGSYCTAVKITMACNKIFHA